MELGLQGKVAVVTGATAGIGYATARKFVEEGARVAICARTAESVERTVKQLRDLGGDVFGMAADISQPASIDAFFAAVDKTFGRIDILVNNAGTSKRGPFLQMTDEDWAGDMELKVYGAIRCSRVAIPHMKKQGGGRIINLSTIGGKQPAATSMPTSVSRAAGLALTKALSKELAGDNILVNAVCIGKIKAGQHEKNAAAKGVAIDDFYTDFAKDIPLKRVGEAEEAANVIVFLASSAASYVTGSSINLDGGASGVL
ncbi:SDR family NAD(P)-dependent oxidoreductase [Pigmentiphaga litoralis]|uniref:NAD(P)-dependent dehydrogenase (Short-subunit alcohol dehydrogenase family) n=1 Tax=Pigmentiphaga litoralis TaxID=516702 RepID=A0A7Y9ISS8_9BURK|nr:NAD(P)-dependent dehydrogenase (short-subunit alcohol dehydrogenase family) [Pigmentiphaga litoralis]NYE82400.1 NAD(P)-dependent dehydrogenase (short-subunit alcohol dehydrogenase family) [Pigmentiphaga litoralis]